MEGQIIFLKFTGLGKDLSTCVHCNFNSLIPKPSTCIGSHSTFEQE